MCWSPRDSSKLFEDRCFLDYSDMNEYYFCIKKDISLRWGSPFTSSYMHGAKCYGNIYLFIYRKITYIFYWLSISLTFDPLMIFTYGQRSFMTFHSPCLATKKLTSWNPKITTHYTRYTPFSSIIHHVTHDLPQKLSHDPWMNIYKNPLQNSWG